MTQQVGNRSQRGGEGEGSWRGGERIGGEDWEERRGLGGGERTGRRGEI